MHDDSVLKCIPDFVATTPEGWTKWKCARCGYKRHVDRHGHFPDRIDRVCNVQVDEHGNEYRRTGDELAALLVELGFKGAKECRCQSMVAWMNQMGAEGCRRNIDTIVGRLDENKRLQSKWSLIKAGPKAFMLGVFTTRQLVLKAIKRAETNQT